MNDRKSASGGHCVQSAEEISADWIAYSRYQPNKAPKKVSERGWVIYEKAQDDPSMAWEAIKLTVKAYSVADLFTDAETEARGVISNIAAGPLEELLSHHGPVFIEKVETEARIDRRMFWALGCVWQNSMADDIWQRVRRAAGEISR